MVADYNTQFGQRYEEHANALQYSDAQLDCIEAETLVADWKSQVEPAPDPILQALIDEWFDRLSDGFTACTEAETLGDWRDVNNQIADAVAVFPRMEERINQSP